MTLEAEDRNDDLDVQDLDDVKAPSDLGKEADNDLGDKTGDKAENCAEKGTDEGTDFSEETTELDLDGNGDDSDDGSTGFEDEVQEAGEEFGNGGSIKNTSGSGAEDPVQWKGNKDLNIGDNTLDGDL